MKVVTILGTRPEIIRLSQIIEKLDHLCDHRLIHTGQNFDSRLSDIFFQEMQIRLPDTYLDVKGETFGEQTGQILTRVNQLLIQEKPQAVLILGDTNSGLSAIVAKRLGIPVYHMEAGNRCYDDRVPEEVNRRMIDHSSDILMPYTERSRQNLTREGLPGEKIFVIGNPIYEVIQHYDAQIQRSKILDDLQLTARRYFLVTMHRAENVDVESRLRSLSLALDQLQRKYQVPAIISTHPHTKARLREFSLISNNEELRFLPPFGFFDFITLERSALVVLSDSGTVQEECALFGIPNVTIRDVTERPETVECGSNMLSGAEVEQVLLSVETVLALKDKWSPPREYLVPNVSDIVLKILLGYRCDLRRA